jgi:hypothetical protein
VLLTSRSRSPEAFAFYHTEALRVDKTRKHLEARK